MRRHTYSLPHLLPMVLAALAIHFHASGEALASPRQEPAPSIAARGHKAWSSSPTPTASPAPSSPSPQTAHSAPEGTPSIEGGTARRTDNVDSIRLRSETAHERRVEGAIGRQTGKGVQSYAYDRALSQGAKNLATQILRHPLGTPLSAIVHEESIQESLRGTGICDELPVAIVRRASTPEKVSQGLVQDIGNSGNIRERFGISVLSLQENEAGPLSAGIVLTSGRKVEFTRFPQNPKAGQKLRFSGNLLKGLTSPELATTAPDGKVRRIRSTTGHPGERGFDYDITFETPGSYRLEILGQGPFGISVAALCTLDVADPVTGLVPERKALPIHPSPSASPTSAEGPPSGNEKRAASARAQEAESASTGRAASVEDSILQAINGIRRSNGLSPLRRSVALDKAALHHASEMNRLGFFGHRSPEEGDVGQRLRRSGISYALAAENLAEASSWQAAERLIENSPGHRDNLLIPTLEEVGIGFMPVQKRPGNFFLVQIFTRRNGHR